MQSGKEDAISTRVAIELESIPPVKITWSLKKSKTKQQNFSPFIDEIVSAHEQRTPWPHEENRLEENL